MRFGLVVLQPVIDLNHFSKIGIGEQAQIIEVPTVQVSDARRQKMPGLPFYTDVPGKLLKCPHESSGVPADQGASAVWWLISPMAAVLPESHSVETAHTGPLPA